MLERRGGRLDILVSDLQIAPDAFIKGSVFVLTTGVQRHLGLLSCPLPASENQFYPRCSHYPPTPRREAVTQPHHTNTTQGFFYHLRNGKA